ncbi:putative stage IV sporulation protein [Lentibacillus sp. JNUCC-1]|uniref:sporulation protein YqfD n=1 Tax=Lentibacillus sp. JNUCC-1 TaxID=2654513 RepID=UPI0012E8B1BE|nr:sporulation protein YqfD [Lentibacillus sp. JNUCC-1]MUV39600.1 putative stage IV sporulation protein [Lentibacillus sp. JNUCC-1]
MRQIQATFLTGYVTIRVYGGYPERFFQKLSLNGIQIWDVKKEQEMVCTGKMRLNDVKRMRSFRRGTHYKVSFQDKKGLPIMINNILRKRALVIALVMSAALVFILSNMVWKIEINNVSKELEEKIDTSLSKYGIREGSWALSLDAPNVIQRKLIEDIPDLLWIGVSKKGTTYFFEGVEKIVVEEEEAPSPRNLIASKNGVIENMYVSKGLPLVHVNDFVNKGDLLVAGELQFGEEDDEEDSAPKSKVAADGEIIARTWYKTTVTVPMKTNTEKLTGEHKRQYALKFGETKLPIWGFKKPDYQTMHQDIQEHPLYFLKWKLPITFQKTIISETEQKTETRTRDEAMQIGKKQATKELQLQLGPKAEIVSSKVLHESVGRGKVKLIIYLTVKEDITETQPLTQGD